MAEEYYLITDSNIKQYIGKIYEFNVALCNTTKLSVKSLQKIDVLSITVPKNDIIVFDNTSGDKWRNVTHVYSKMCRLYITTKDEIIAQKLDKICERFENGIFPTKSEFKYMNKLQKKWKKQLNTY